MKIGRRLGQAAGSRAGQIAPGPTSAAMHRALQQAISGVGPLPGAASAADKQLREQKGTGAADVDAAIKDVIGNHVRLSGVQGFATNLGGLVTLAVAIPANIAGLALLQCRMVACIAYLRGYDLSDPAVHNAILTCVLGKEEVARQVKRKKLPGGPRAIATSPHDTDLDKVVAQQLVTALVTRVAGRKVATTVAKRVPVVGGVIGAGTDARSTWAVGKYAAAELTAR